MPVRLVHHRYGKSRVRLVKVTRLPDRHQLKEVTVSIHLQGDFEAAYAEGDNRRVLPTDTLRNTVYALAKDHPLEQIEEFGLFLGQHLLETVTGLSLARIDLAEEPWERVTIAGTPHGHAFVHGGGGK